MVTTRKYSREFIWVVVVVGEQRVNAAERPRKASVQRSENVPLHRFIEFFLSEGFRYLFCLHLQCLFEAVAVTHPVAGNGVGHGIGRKWSRDGEHLCPC